MELATFGAGCFWGVEEAFRNVDGVVNTAAGYAGGTTDNPTYKEVCSGRTGHAEVVQVEFDPARVSYEQLLELFWSIHDPTQLNRQGPDVGNQYRTVIFHHSDTQREAAAASRDAADRSGRFRRPIVTEIAPAPAFWRAEEHHQRYIAKGGPGACAISPPKLALFLAPALLAVGALCGGCYKHVIRAEGIGSRSIDTYEPNSKAEPDALDNIMFEQSTPKKKRRH